MNRATAHERSLRFLAGERLTFAEADALWRQLKYEEPSLARPVLARIRAGASLSDGLPDDAELLDNLCRQHALLTSKDLDLSASVRHDYALKILAERFPLSSPGLDGDFETLGIAGGIHKRRFDDLGQLKDLRLAAGYYNRGTKGPLGEDAYAHINAAFLEDLLVDAGDDPDERRARADALRRRILDELPVLPDNWWNAATRAEAHVGLGDYAAALEAIRVEARPEPWELQTTARQLARLAQVRGEWPPQEVPGLEAFFLELLSGSAQALHSLLIGKVGLALSGGGFRASFYHLGVLARLAELDMLRHLEVLSCVSGGSIVGVCYWLSLRRRLLEPSAGGRVDYTALVRELIDFFECAVARDLREQIQPSRLRSALGLLGGWGLLPSRKAAAVLERDFLRPLLPGDGPLFMDALAFEPLDHEMTGSATFDPTTQNWLRTDKVPELLINATTINTGRLWMFTPKQMGEPPSFESTGPLRLEWAAYDKDHEWRIPAALAVAASSCAPWVFSPVPVEGGYADVKVKLVDGGLFDNTGSQGLLERSCSILLVSDAAGPLQLHTGRERGISGFVSYSSQAFSTMMERSREGNQAALLLRLRDGFLRALMYVDLKTDLRARRLAASFSRVPADTEDSELTFAGIRLEFQRALADLRTDLNAFSPDEARSLMACGYQMTAVSFQRDMAHIREFAAEPRVADWQFLPQLREITTSGPLSDRGSELLRTLQQGSMAGRSAEKVLGDKQTSTAKAHG